MGIRGAHNILPARTMNLQLGQTAEVHIGKAIDTRDYTLETKEKLISDVRDAIQRLAGDSPALT